MSASTPEPNQSSWDEFVSSQPHTPILQSWAWGEFNRALGSDVVRLVVTGKQGEIRGLAQGIVSHRRSGRFIYVPHGPVGPDLSVKKTLMSQLKDKSRELGVDYLRIEPHEKNSPALAEWLAKQGLRKAPTFVQAEMGWILPLEKSEEELMSEMRKTTRYLVRKAEKMGVAIRVSTDPKDLEQFHRLMQETAQRQGFSPQNRRYLTTQFETLSPAGVENLYLASFEGRVLAAAIIASFGDTAAYLHGASEAGMVPAAYLLQWQAILDAKASGRKIYDFWGIAPNDNPRHPWAGLTLFKLGFGGQPLPFVGAWDYPLTRRYYLTTLLEHVRKTIRHI